MSWAEPVLKCGKCPNCGVVYRWEAKDGFRLRDAVCIECGTSLVRAYQQKAGPKRVEPRDVDCEWLRASACAAPES